jgi:two-component system copper resistance phosphate regulon response regulator CusR
MRILLIEDEPDAARMLAKGLREEAYAVDVAGDGERALELASFNDYDLVILDVMLPRKGGLEVCRELRTAGSAVPVLMLTALDAVEDRVEGLDSGADDYLPKPFDFEELLARVRALLRRRPALYPEVIAVADLSIDTRARRARRGGRDVELTAKEYALLEYLARRVGDVVGRADIAEHVWDDTSDPFSKVIEVFIQRLRRKVDEGHDLKLIRTRRGEGYTLTAGRPDDAGVRRVLEIIDAPESGRVFVHCRDGVDRTGTVTAIYRITREGWTLRNALTEAERRGMRRIHFWMRDYVEDYAPLRGVGAGSAAQQQVNEEDLSDRIGAGVRIVEGKVFTARKAGMRALRRVPGAVSGLLDGVF